MENKIWKKIVKKESNKADWQKVENNIGMVVAGYRFGDLHPRGYSLNHTTGQAEPGYSMASVMGLEQCGSLAACNDGRKKVYVIGKIAGIGSDDEVCLSDVRVVTYGEYREFLRDNKEKGAALKKTVKAVVKTVRLCMALNAQYEEHLIIGSNIYDKSGRMLGNKGDYKDAQGNWA